MAIQMVPQYQVFINFRGEDVRETFLGYLKKDFQRNGVNFFTDEDEQVGEKIEKLLERVIESRVALVIFSSKYTESKWCLKELAKIKECVDQGTMKAVPIFYRVEINDVKHFNGDFGKNFRKTENKHQDKEEVEQWRKAVEFFAETIGLRSEKYREEVTFVEKVVDEVKQVLLGIKDELTEIQPVNFCNESSHGDVSADPVLPGIGKRLEELEEKMKVDSERSRVIGVVGMHGIGKTALAEALFENQKMQGYFHCFSFLRDVHKLWKEYGEDWLWSRLLEDLLKDDLEDLLRSRVLIILDDVCDERQIDFLNVHRQWFKQGSRIVVTTTDMSLIKGRVNDTYRVPGLDYKDSIKYFISHATSEHHRSPPQEILEELSEEFVAYARGNPLALKVLGGELRGKDEIFWESRLHTLTQSPNMMIQDVLKKSYDCLSQQQKDAFIDIACFFRLEEEGYVRDLVDSCCPKSRSEIRDLADKFLIDISSGRVEMHDVLHSFGRELASLASHDYRLWNHRDIISALKNKSGNNTLRGIFLDMSQLSMKIALDNDTFAGMCGLRYLKFFSSRSPPEFETNRKIEFPGEFEQFCLDQVRYLEWLKFPLKELPQDFDPKNLVDLKLPYSKLIKIWSIDKDTPKLKLVDLSHSTQLCNLSGLLRAENIQRLNLGGCTNLKELPEGMKIMRNLIFLNLRGCTSLRYLPAMNLDSLKTLILSSCSKLKQFQVISEKLEFLYLDGTAIDGLPQDIERLQRLILLNMKCCEMLECLPSCIGKLKALQKLILSGCSKLQSFPEVEGYMENLQILLLDGTSIKENILCSRISNRHGLCKSLSSFNNLSLMQRLQLSRNNMICGLEAIVGELFNLKVLDLKYCKNLTSIQRLPPNLQCLDAHGCVSLDEVNDPLAGIQMEQISSTFIFTNCYKLDKVAKNNIITYAQKKTHLMSDAINCLNGAFHPEAFISTCFPGCQVPAWFSHQAVGSVLKLKLHPLRYNSRCTAIALCVVISFQDYKDQNDHISVNCYLKFRNEDGSISRFTCIVWDWNESGNKPRAIEKDHVFIGYTRCSHIMRHLDDQNSKSVLPETSFKFKVTNGIYEIEKCHCEVLKCGFSLVSGSDPADNF